MSGTTFHQNLLNGLEMKHHSTYKERLDIIMHSLKVHFTKDEYKLLYTIGSAFIYVFVYVHLMLYSLKDLDSTIMQPANQTMSLPKYLFVFIFLQFQTYKCKKCNVTLSCHFTMSDKIATAILKIRHLRYMKIVAMVSV